MNGRKRKLVLDWLAPRALCKVEKSAQQITQSLADCDTVSQLNSFIDRVLFGYLGVQESRLYLSAGFLWKRGSDFYRVEFSPGDMITTTDICLGLPDPAMSSVLDGDAVYGIGDIYEVRHSASLPDYSCLSGSAAVPVVSKSRVVGVLLLGRRGKTRYSKTERACLREISHQLGAALWRIITLQVATKALLQKEQLVDDIKRIIHDIKNPVGSILGLLELFPMAEPERSVDIEEAVLDALHRLNQAVDVLNGKGGRRKLLHFNDLVERCAARFTLSSILLDLGELPDIFANESEIESLLENLLKNAIEAEGVRGHRQSVEVKTWCEPDTRQIACQVKDCGGGIPPDRLPDIWKSNPSDKEHGSGVGMEMIKRIVDSHDGTITVKSVPGEGATITFLLPYAMYAPSHNYAVGI